MARIIQAAQLVGYNRRKDKTVTVRFTTQELLDISVIDEMARDEAAGILYFRADDRMVMNPEEEKELDAIDLDLYDNPKSQSQRLRGVLYRLWEQRGEGEFKQFYKHETDKIIQTIKDKLDP